MKNIADIDKNFRVETTMDLPDVTFYDPKQAPFRIYGVFHDGEKFRRMPEAVAETVSEGVLNLHAHTAGGRIRFKTDSPYIAIRAELENISKMGHFTMCGTAGFDVYVGKEHVTSFVPSPGIVDVFEGYRPIGNPEMREITIHLPLYSNVKEVYIGLSESATVEEGVPYTGEKPVVYYGSSVTQGGCASRPGMSYQNILSNRLNIDHVNLGFSGNAKAENTMIEYLAGLDMSAFVLDYDFNAPSAEHLKNTHEKLFKAVRATHPTLPIIIMNRPRYNLDSNQQKRLEIILQTYTNAKNSGDENVYFISGRELMALAGDEATVDRTHPTDLGFFSMANAIEPVLKTILHL